MTEGFDRRRFLGVLAGAAGLPWLAVACSRRGRPRMAEPLVGLLTHTGSAAALGASYLGAHPSEDLHSLTGALAHDLSWEEGMESDTLAARLVELLRADFAAGRTVTVSGWTLAVSEARLCAVASVLTSAPPEVATGAESAGLVPRKTPGEL